MVVAGGEEWGVLRSLGVAEVGGCYDVRLID